MHIRKVALLLAIHAHERRPTVSASERLLRQTRRKLKAEGRSQEVTFKILAPVKT